MCQTPCSGFRTSCATRRSVCGVCGSLRGLCPVTKFGKAHNLRKTGTQGNTSPSRGLRGLWQFAGFVPGHNVRRSAQPSQRGHTGQDHSQPGLAGFVAVCGVCARSQLSEKRTTFAKRVPPTRVCGVCGSLRGLCPVTTFGKAHNLRKPAVEEHNAHRLLQNFSVVDLGGA